MSFVRLVGTGVTVGEESVVALTVALAASVAVPVAPFAVVDCATCAAKIT